jgi:hypothetical protein
LFLSPDGQVMAVQMVSASPPKYGPPRPLFVLPETGDFDLNGQRLLALMPLEQAGGRQLEVILNWAADLRR